MEEFRIKVEGMHCGGCEALVKEDVGEIDGVKSVQASHKDGLVIVRYEGKLDTEKARKAITALGYKVND